MLHDTALQSLSVETTSCAIIFGLLYLYFRNKHKNNSFTDLDDWKPFDIWKTRCGNELITNGLEINDIHIIDKCMFGKRLGFLYVDVDASYDGKKVPGRILFRGGSCCVFMWFELDGRIFVLLIKQLRLPIGKFIWEIPAGMIDESNNIHSKMMDEITEETGIEPKAEELNYMGKGFTSCGLLDEEISFYEMEIDSTTVLNINKCGTDEEIISDIQFFPIDENPCDDMKFLAAKGLFKKKL
tara:strand:+ start:7369 stop:8091 length:723 start_codon:yes stop_codon:yes gene_type:complete